MPLNLVGMGYVIDRTWHCPHCRSELQRDIYYKKQLGTMAFDVPLREVMAKCPHRRCLQPLSLEERRRVHLLDETITCSGCLKHLCYETFQIADFIRENPTIKYHGLKDRTCSKSDKLRYKREIPDDGRWPTFLAVVEAAVETLRSQFNDEFAWGSVKIDVMTKAALFRSQAIGAFPIDLVQAMHRDLRFVATITSNAAYWTKPEVIAAAVRRYEQFLPLCSSNTVDLAKLVPTVDIALIDRVQRTFHARFCAHSRAVTTIVRPPPSDLTPEAYIKTCAAWTKAYREAYSSYLPDGLTPKTMIKSGALLAVGDSQFHGVGRRFSASELTELGGKAPKTCSNATHGDLVLSVIGTPVLEDAA
ncbi:hypothetical protein ACHHYP_06841 [Achlya hypogyna]|uniref:Uncharacterized protein n=1 Tax=Achlya hypogyna TaxID=1202772 RepID=A0A1V9YRI7_ACHHY|nr:hypothetical protein ACHHYP_06841 [Achlya hypogyna]